MAALLHDNDVLHNKIVKVFNGVNEGMNSVNKFIQKIALFAQ
jgi:hypothetical protein